MRVNDAVSGTVLVLFALAEIAYTRKLCAKHGWPVIDVTRRSVEETAATIIRLMQDVKADQEEEEAAKAGQIVGADLVELAPLAGFHAADYTAAALAYKMMSYALSGASLSG